MSDENLNELDFYEQFEDLFYEINQDLLDDCTLAITYKCE